MLTCDALLVLICLLLLAVSGAQQRSGDAAAAAAANADVISSGAVAADGTARRTSSVNRSAGAAGGGSHGTAAAAAAAAAAAGGSGGSRGNTGSGQLRGGSFRSGGGVAPGEQEAISQEDDSEPVTKGASSGRGGRSGSGGRKSGSVPGAAGAAMLGVTGGEGAADAEGEPLGGAVGDNEQLGDADADDAEYDGLMTGRRSDEGVGEEGADAALMCAPIMPRRVRQVPRQSSAINLGTRAGPAEMKRMAAEVESLRGENQLLHMQLQRMQQQQHQQQAAQAGGGGGSQQQPAAAAGGRETGQCSPQAEGSAAGAGAGAGGGGGSSRSRLDALEREMAVLKQQVGCWCLPCGARLHMHHAAVCCAFTQLPFAADVSDAQVLCFETWVSFNQPDQPGDQEHALCVHCLITTAAVVVAPACSWVMRFC